MILAKLAIGLEQLELLLTGFASILVLIDSKTEKAIEEDGLTDHFKKAAGSGGGGDRGSSSGNSGSGGNGGSGTAGGTGETSIIGFHSPSAENIYGNNRYRKPKGVGYPTAPKGGLHPLYVIDLANDDDKRAKLQLSSYYYAGDDYESSPYANVRLEMTSVQNYYRRRPTMTKSTTTRTGTITNRLRTQTCVSK